MKKTTQKCFKSQGENMNLYCTSMLNCKFTHLYDFQQILHILRTSYWKLYNDYASAGTKQNFLYKFQYNSRQNYNQLAGKLRSKCDYHLSTS